MYKKLSFPFHFSADLVTFTAEIRMVNFIFCAVIPARTILDLAINHAIKLFKPLRNVLNCLVLKT